MSRFARRTDDNQAQLVATFRRIGCAVFSLASVGRGCPDLLVGCAGRNWLVEVKDGSKAASKRKLTPLEAEFHAMWPGPVAVVETVEDVLALVAQWRAGVASDVEVDPSDWERP